MLKARMIGINNSSEISLRNYDRMFSCSHSASHVRSLTQTNLDIEFAVRSPKYVSMATALDVDENLRWEKRERLSSSCQLAPSSEQEIPFCKQIRSRQPNKIHQQSHIYFRSFCSARFNFPVWMARKLRLIASEVAEKGEIMLNLNNSDAIFRKCCFI
jgi:hypothetical protein